MSQTRTLRNLGSHNLYRFIYTSCSQVSHKQGCWWWNSESGNICRDNYTEYHAGYSSQGVNILRKGISIAGQGYLYIYLRIHLVIYLSWHDGLPMPSIDVDVLPFAQILCFWILFMHHKVIFTKVLFKKHSDTESRKVLRKAHGGNHQKSKHWGQLINLLSPKIWFLILLATRQVISLHIGQESLGLQPLPDK